MIDAYPLTWPAGFPRSGSRMEGAFKTSLAKSLSNVEKSVSGFGKDSGKKIEAMVISSNVSIGNVRPTDPGIAVWFTWDGIQVCIPIDRYTKVEANLQAVHHVVEARRTELRHGGIAIVRATFTGFKALPAPVESRDWRKVLEIGAETSLESARENFRRLSSLRHPDKGGSHNAMAELNLAWQQAQAALQ